MAEDFSGKRSFSQLQATKMRCPREILDDEDGPVKKKLKKNLIDIFNRASMCVNSSEDHMSVFLRIKPVDDSSEENQGCLKVNEADQSVVASAPESSHTHKSLKRGLGKSEHKFTFSRIFNDNTSQAEFFNETMLGMTKEFISGQNSLVFTYGVTSSGKTYTIQGQPQDAGILPRSLDVLFNSISGKQIEGIRFKPVRFTEVKKLSQEEENSEYKIKEKTLKMSSDDDTTYSALLGDETDAALSCTMASCSSNSQDDSLPEIESRIREELKVDVDDHGKFNFIVWISFGEIYNEQIFDLLEKFSHKKGCKRTPLKIAEDQNGSPYIKGLKEIHVESADEAYRLLTIGKRNLQTASTRLNHCSSRSHCIFTIKVIRVVDKDDPNIARVSMLSFCDLAGSERSSKTQATGDRLKEAGNINTSLLTLGRCIEILRFNQVHRESQKIVPFRDSKLTRLFQNFFNGSGRAAMIVNVSQSTSMFDETLHVFKFSAIAKQVKYLQKPIEPPKPKKKKTLPPLPRPSIPWEIEGPSKALLENASNDPLPIDEDSEGESNSDVDYTDMDYILSRKSPEELRETVKTLLDKNAKLLESLEEEMINSSNTEIRVRREVCELMKKQQVLIEKEYSKLLEESEEEAKETMDERIQNVIDIYEEKLERIQRKVDEEDEWVSSLLFFQEQKKVQEQSNKISQLEKLLQEKGKPVDDLDKDKDEKIEQLEEYIAELRSIHHSREKEKDEKIDELESYIQEAGDVYKENMAQIAKLRQEAATFALEAKAKEDSLLKLQSEISDREILYAQSVGKIEQLEKDRETHESNASEQVCELKSLIKEMENKIETKDNTIKTLEEECQQMQDEIEHLQDQMSQADNLNKRSDLESSQDAVVVQTEAIESEEVEILKARITELERTGQELTSERTALEEKCDSVANNNLELKQKVESLLEKEIEVKDLMEVNKELNAEIVLLQEESKKQALKQNKPQTPAQSSVITDMVHELERKSTPCDQLKLCGSMCESDDEIVLKQNLSSQASEYVTSKNIPPNALQLKDAELTINALRNKLKREEEDFFKREQALIHGYTAEIDNLKLNIVKLKSKIEVSKTKTNNSKQSETETKDVSFPVDDCMDEGDESVRSIGNKQEENKSVSVLMSELSSCQEQLFSCRSAYHQLQSKIKCNKASSFAHQVVVGTSDKRQSTQGVICIEDNMTDSVLQFEMTEYAIKFDMLKNKGEEQYRKIAEQEKLLQNAESRYNELEENFNIVSGEKDALQNEREKEKLGLSEFEVELRTMKERVEELQRVIEQKDAFLEEVSSKLNNSLTAKIEMKQSMDDLNDKIERLEEEISEKNEIITERSTELDEALNKNSDSSKELMSLQSIVENLKKENQEAEVKIKEQQEEKYKDGCHLENSRKEWQHLQITNSTLNNENEELKKDLKELKNKFSLLNSEIENHEKDTSSKESELDELRSQLFKEKEAVASLTDELEHMKRDHQQESADVSQKLILLEKEKRVAERKVTEMKGKEHEWQMKCQGQEKMIELEHQLQKQLKTTTEALKRHSAKIKELSEELDKQKSEMLQLKEERDCLKKDFDNLQADSSKTEHKCILLRNEADHSQKRAEELLSTVNNLKAGLQDSDETTEHQEKIITTQDEQINSLKSRLDDLGCEKDELVKKGMVKDKEITALEMKIKQIQELEDKATVNEEKFQKVDNEKCDLEMRLKKLKAENENLEEELEKRVNKAKKDRKELEDLQEEIREARNEAQKCKDKVKTIENELEKVNGSLGEEIGKRTHLQKEMDLLMKEHDTDKSRTSIDYEELKKENKNLQENIEHHKKDLKAKDEIVENMKLQTVTLKQNLEQREKDLAKKESINRRNKEEMEVWKKEKDMRVANFEEVFKKVVQEKKDLVQENEKLKKDNADLVKEVTNSRSAKDKVIADMRKNNNTLSIELASLQGMSPPPKMETPDHGFPNPIEFIEDNDTTGHLEVDATPPVCLKKSKKRHLSTKNISTSLVDLDNSTPVRKSLRTIEETNEQSPRSSESIKDTPSSVASSLANDIFSTLSPLTRSGKSHIRGKQKKAPPVSNMAMDLQDENELPLAARRSSRLRSKSTSKHSVV